MLTMQYEQNGRLCERDKHPPLSARGGHADAYAHPTFLGSIEGV